MLHCRSGKVLHGYRESFCSMEEAMVHLRHFCALLDAGPYFNISYCEVVVKTVLVAEPRPLIDPVRLVPALMMRVLGQTNYSRQCLFCGIWGPV
jgi:hypothetical protein